MALTRRQRDVLDFVARFQEEHGHCPSYEEIGRGLDLSSLATVHKHVSTLETKGYLRRGQHQSRSLELSGKFMKEQRQIRAATSSLPLMGRVAAGRPVEAVENPESISLADFTGKENVFVLQVTGDSMVEDHIQEGDYIIVEKAETARNGEMVVALLDGQDATLKRFYREGDKVRLQPANSKMNPIMAPAASVQVQGKVIGVLRRYKN